MTLELHHQLILERDRSVIDHKVISSWSSNGLKNYGLDCSDEDLINGQPHQRTRRFLRDSLIAKLGDEDLLDETLIDDFFGDTEQL